MDTQLSALELLAEAVVDNFEGVQSGQAMYVPADMVDLGQERMFLIALVDACRRRPLPIKHVLSPPQLVRPAAFENAEAYQGVHLIQNPDDTENIVLVRG